MHETLVILIINVFVIIGVLYSVIKFRYDKQFQSSKFKTILYWMAITLIILENVFSIIHNLF